MTKLKRGWRVLRDCCSRNWYYIRDSLSLLPRLYQDPLEFETREEALTFATELYALRSGFWNTWSTPAVIFESPDGERETYWLVGPEARIKIAQQRKSHGS